jgi:hypothetical protein
MEVSERYQSYTLNKTILDEFNPDVVILSFRGSGRKCWMKPGTKMADREWILSKGLGSERRNGRYLY